MPRKIGNPKAADFKPSSPKVISLKPLKSFSMQDRPDSLFTKVILQEPDEISEADFKAKLSAWFSILEIESHEQRVMP